MTSLGLQHARRLKLDPAPQTSDLPPPPHPPQGAPFSDGFFWVDGTGWLDGA